MITINVISDNILSKKILKEPQNYFDKKIKLINKKNLYFKKKKLIFSLFLSGAKEIKKLNKKFRNKDKVTDVLSFPFYEKKELLKIMKKEKEIYIGDVIINLNILNHKRSSKNFKEQLNKLWIHGLLHLLGYTHNRLKNFESMNRLEKMYLRYIN